MFHKNLECLKIYYEDLYQKVQVNLGNYYKIEDTNGFKNLTIENQYVHSKYNPENEAINWVNGLEINEEDTICILGLGLGYILEPLILNYYKKKLIIIEPNIEIFKNLLSVYDITPYIKNENIVFLVGKSSNEIRMLFEHYIQNNKINKICFKELPFYKKNYSQYIEELYMDLKKILMLLKSNLSTTMCFSRDWLYNTLRNLKYIDKYNNVECLEDNFKNIPVVIVSAGPSLEKNMSLLKNIYNKALIIAVGTSASILDSNGIKAHIVIGIDGHPVETEVFKSLKNHDALFIYANMIHYQAIEAYEGNKMWMYLQGESGLGNLFKKIGVEFPAIVTGGSVAHTALAFSHWAQCNPIILIGQDLAYTNEKLYASGSSHQEDYISKENYILEKDIYGNEAYTKTAFITYKHWFEDYVKLKMDNKTNIINCTEGGLPITGIPNMQLREVIDIYCKQTYNLENIIVDALSKKTSISEASLEKKLCEYKKQLEICIKLSEKRLQKISKILQKELYNDEKFSKLIDDILKLTKNLEKIEFYNVFIKKTGEMYNDTITKATNLQMHEKIKILEKRKVITKGLFTQYSFAHDNLKVAKGALENTTVNGLYFI